MKQIEVVKITQDITCDCCDRQAEVKIYFGITVWECIFLCEKHLSDLYKECDKILKN